MFPCILLLGHRRLKRKISVPQILNYSLFFIVAPQISLFSFGEEPINADEMASVQCAVVKGDLPLDISWMFNGNPIGSDQSDVNIIDNGKRHKQLTIESVSARHAGEYTCVASNIAGSVSRTAVLDINGIS